MEATFQRLYITLCRTSILSFCHATSITMVVVSNLSQQGAQGLKLTMPSSGWVIGNTGDDDAFNRSVAEACDAVVVDVGYRLAPEHKFPVAVFDAWEAYYYVASHASDLGVDPRRLAVGGFSAGAHLAAEVCLMARTEERDARWRYKPCFQLLVIPVCDAGALDDDLQVAKGTIEGFDRTQSTIADLRYYCTDCPYASWTEHHDAPFLSHARMSWFYRHFLHHSFNRHLLEQASLSPIRTDSLAGLPPALVVPAEVDVLRDEGIAFARKLAKESGNFTQLWLARNVPHPFPHQLDATDVAVEFRQLALQRLREAFNGELIGKKEFISNV